MEGKAVRCGSPPREGEDEPGKDGTEVVWSMEQEVRREGAGGRMRREDLKEVDERVLRCHMKWEGEEEMME